MNASTLSRRTFLKATGGLVVAIGLSPGVRSRLVLAAGPASVPSEQVDSWLAIGPDGTVTVFTGKVELGTGLATATKQIAAEELDVPIDRIKLVEGDTWTTPDQGYTAGSQSIKSQWTSGLRQAAATARQKLLDLAAPRLGATPDQLTIASGVITLRSDPNKKVSYSDLLGGQKFASTVSRGARPKPVSQYSVIGKSIPRDDIPAKVTGEFQFIQDVRLPGMVHARAVRPMRPAPAASGSLAALPAGTRGWPM